MTIDTIDTINVICDNCRREGFVPAAYAGRRGRCRKCGASLVVPMPATAEVSLPASLFESSSTSDTHWDLPTTGSDLHIEKPR